MNIIKAIQESFFIKGGWSGELDRILAELIEHMFFDTWSIRGFM